MMGASDVSEYRDQEVKPIPGSKPSVRLGSVWGSSNGSKVRVTTECSMSASEEGNCESACSFSLGSTPVLLRTPPHAQEPSQSDSCSPTRQFQTEHASANRKQVAEWLARTLGVSVPSHSDREFRAALQDGTILCSALNVAANSTNMKVRTTHMYLCATE